MTWRRLTRDQARAEALVEYRERVQTNIVTGRLLCAFIEQDEARREAALQAARPVLAGMSSPQILEALHSAFGDAQNLLPCDDPDVLSAILEELERRRNASAHERIRLRELDRKT